MIKNRVDIHTGTGSGTYCNMSEIKTGTGTYDPERTWNLTLVRFLPSHDKKQIPDIS
jgi:hypothetical protein